jgi:hypothetical protein
MATIHAFGQMIQGDLRLVRQGNTLIVHSKHNARWFGALLCSFALFFLIKWISMPDQSGFALLGYWFGVVIGVTLVGIGVFLSLPREVTTTLLWLPFLPCVLRYIVTHDLSLGFSETGWPFLLPQPELSLARLQSARDDT